MLRSRGISQIYHTYSEDMQIYPLLPWLLRGVAEVYVTMVAEDIRVHILRVGVVYLILIGAT